MEGKLEDEWDPETIGGMRKTLPDHGESRGRLFRALIWGPKTSAARERAEKKTAPHRRQWVCSRRGTHSRFFEGGWKEDFHGLRKCAKSGGAGGKALPVPD